MSRLWNAVLNLRIGTKLGITSGFGVLMVAAMVGNQMMADNAIKADYEKALTQLTVVREAVDAKASVRGMQIGTRDVRLASNPDALKRALDYIEARHKSANGFADALLSHVRVEENRKRVEQLKVLNDKYVAGTNEIAKIRSEAIAIESRRAEGQPLSPEAAARVAALNEQAMRFARDVTLPIAAESEALVNKIGEVAKHGAEASIEEANSDMARAELIGEILGGIAFLVLLGAAFFGFATIARPMKALTGGMIELANGNFSVVLPGLGRKDEIGDVAAAVETFKVKSAEKARTEAEAKAEQDRKEAAECTERERIAAEEKVEQDKRAAAERAAEAARVMNEFDAAVGGIVKAALVGDFSQRVSLDGKEGVIRNLAESMNTMCEMIGLVLDDMAKMLGAMAEGDLTQRIDANYEGTFGMLKDRTNTTAARLAETVSGIKTAANEVANAAGEISTSTTDLSQRTEEQAAGLEETSASMEQISVTVKKNAENAQQANALATSTQEVADRGGAVVAEAVGAMSRIEESSRQIADIIGVIDEIARQTNLLALNAAVEAARAGDAGRGFAVVASEVRSLAQRSSQAAKDIKDLITNSSSQVQEGVDLVNRAGSSLNEIVESIKKVAAIVSDIASASTEQATGIDQVNKALSQMDEVTQQNSALVEENAATAKTLEDQSKAMDDRVSYFQIEAAKAQTTRAVAAAATHAPAPARAASTPVKRGGPVGRMQSKLATALKAEHEFAEF